MNKNVLIFTAAIVALPAGFSMAAGIGLTPESISRLLPRAMQRHHGGGVSEQSPAHD